MVCDCLGVGVLHERTLRPNLQLTTGFKFYCLKKFPDSVHTREDADADIAHGQVNVQSGYESVFAPATDSTVASEIKLKKCPIPDWR